MQFSDSRTRRSRNQASVSDTLRVGKQKAMIVALACSDAPEDQTRWTAKPLANRAVEWEVIESVSETTVRRVLKKTR